MDATEVDLSGSDLDNVSIDRPLIFVIRISVPFHGSVPTNRTLSSTCTGPLSIQ